MSITNRFKSGLGVALIAAVVGGFAAAPAGADSSGVPNTNACVGQFVSDFVPGIGAKVAAASFGYTVKEAAQVIFTACGR